jgi:hypothetical protein
MSRVLPPVTAVERAGLVAGLALLAALMAPIRDYLTDDTFIHLQYARNLAEGQGLVFNRGERVYGCTSPLWVALVADGMSLGLDGLLTAKALGFLAALASVGLFLQLLRRTVETPLVRAAATVAWASHAWMARWAVSGMETALAVMLVLAGFVAFTAGHRWGARPVWTGTLWSLAALARPEAALLLMLWGVLLLVETENRFGLRRLIAGIVPAALIYGGWLLFARLYFGTFWPQTLVAKAAGGDSPEFHAENLWRQAQLVGATDGLLAATLVASVALGRLVRIAPQPLAQRWLPWAWLALLPALYVARGVPVLSRYLLVLLPVLAWLAWRAAEQWWLGPRPDAARARRAGLLAVALGALVVAQNLAVYVTTVVPQVRSFTPALEQSLIRWGRWFGRHARPEAAIATPDIGAVGYFSRRRVVDLGGLVTPAMVPYLARESPEAAAAAFRFAAFSRPEFLVDRAPEPHQLARVSPFAPALVALGTAPMPNLGVARPAPVVFTFYRVDWARYDSLAAIGR